LDTENICRNDMCVVVFLLTVATILELIILTVIHDTSYNLVYKS